MSICTRAVSRWSVVMFVLAFALVPVGSPRAAAQGPRCVFGEDVNVSHLPAQEAEVSIDVNPTDPDNLVVIGHIEGFDTMNTFYSLDGGETWTLVELEDADDGVDSEFRFDPSLVFDDAGNLYVAYGARYFEDFTRREALVICKSTDGGQSYPQCSIVHTQAAVPSASGVLPGNDKWHMAVAPSTVDPALQNLYIAWTLNQAETVGDPPVLYIDQRIVVSRSSDGGLTWSAPLIIADEAIAGPDGSLSADPAVGPNGELYVSWHDFDDDELNVDASFDGGLTFGTDVLITTVGFYGLFSWIPAQPGRSITPGPVLDVDRSGGPYNGRLYLAYTDYPAGNPAELADVYVRYSDDHGATWSPRVRVNDDDGDSTQFLPWIDVDQTTGTVQMVWYDTRNDADNERVEAFVAASNDGGATFSINMPISDGVSDQSTSNPDRWKRNNFLEYIGIAGLDCGAVAVWSDNSLDPANLDYFVDRFVPSFCGGPPTASGLDQIVECTGGLQATVTLNGGGSSDPDGDIVDYEWYEGAAYLGSGLTLPVSLGLGTHDLTLRAVDVPGLFDCTPVTVTVLDTTAPSILAPANIQAECGGPGGTSIALGTPKVGEACDLPGVFVTNDAPALFPLGTTLVTWTARDTSGNTNTASQYVTVLDTLPPKMLAPADVQAECAGPDGTFVELNVPSVDDICDPSGVVVKNDAPAAFPLGSTVVTWTATDPSGNVTTVSHTVTVVDTTPPKIRTPDDLEAECAGPGGTVVKLDDPIVDDICDPAGVIVKSDAPAVFPLGTTVVTWTATDAAGNEATASQNVTVVDTTPPDITLTVSPDILWPPSHKLREITPAVTASDLCDASPVVELFDITTDEGEETLTYDPVYDATLGDGHTPDDIQVIDGRIFLRAERSGEGDGRVYTITYIATDVSGNTNFATAAVTVPLEQ